MNAAAQRIVHNGLVAALSPKPCPLELVRDKVTDLVVGRLYIGQDRVRWLVDGAIDPAVTSGTAKTVDAAMAALGPAAKAEMNRPGSYLNWRLGVEKRRLQVEAMPEPLRSLNQRLDHAEQRLVTAEHASFYDGKKIARLRKLIAELEAEVAGAELARAA